MTPMVAQVTTTSRARLHLDNDGHAHCGAGNGRTIPTTARPLADATPELLCRRCIKAIRNAADQALAAHAGGGVSQHRTQPVEPLRRLRQTIRTTAEIAADEAFSNRLQIAQQRAAEFKPSVFAQIKQQHAEAALRDREDRAEQLALIAA